MSEMSDMNLRNAINDMKKTISISILANSIMVSWATGQRPIAFREPDASGEATERRLDAALNIAERAYNDYFEK